MCTGCCYSETRVESLTLSFHIRQPTLCPEKECGAVYEGFEHLFFAGALGAVIVTWFTFLFSFVFIFAGAPIIESTHNEIKFTAPLTAITAAVVGVILNLALFFSYHVLWPQGFSGHFDIVAALITVAAFIALFRFNVNVLYVIFASALVGLAVTFF